jgi:predicted negative regulator of RcsB-dependent stress response
MALDLEEQEQLDEFKTWWKENGKLVTNVILGVILAYVAWQGYHYFQNKKAVEASELYQTLVQLEPSNVAEIKMQSAKLIDTFSNTPYAGRAAIFLAKNSFAANDTKNAKAQLEWATANAKETTIKAIAALQLASILFEEKKYNEALKALEAEYDVGYVGLKNDLQGDIYLAQGNKAEAKKSYESALANLDVSGRLFLFTQQKLESLGS